MDGRKNKLMDSLQFRLSIGIFFALTCMALIAGAISYWLAFEEAIELQDEQLIRLSALVNQQKITQPDPATKVVISTADPESHFVVQWLEPKAQEHIELPGLPHNLGNGLQTHIVNDVSWRLFVREVATGARVVVAQQIEMRDELARTSAIYTMVPLLILMPLLLMLLGYIIRQVFVPLKKMAIQLDNSNDADFLPLAEKNLATEIAPFVKAINNLLQRLHQAMLLQRQFVRDAAHELRSPLTAISLQAERLVELSSKSELHARLIKLHSATERTRLLIEQLLTMARSQDKKLSSTTRISLKSLLREVLEDLLTLAEAKNVDLSVSGKDAKVESQIMDLHILIKNLVENAIRYTPNGGQVEVIINENNSEVKLLVKDSGPGISEQELNRVFDPFYRILGGNQPGSGLGLSIVRTIANRLDIDIQLINNGTNEQSGLTAQVTFSRK